MNRLVRIAEIFLPITALVLLIIQVVISNELATLGKKMATLDREVRMHSEARESLTIAVASASSLLQLRERALAEGFVEPGTKQILNLSLQVPVALDTNHSAPLVPVQ